MVFQDDSPVTKAIVTVLDANQNEIDSIPSVSMEEYTLYFFDGLDLNASYHLHVSYGIDFERSFVSEAILITDDFWQTFDVKLPITPFNVTGRFVTPDGKLIQNVGVSIYRGNETRAMVNFNTLDGLINIELQEGEYSLRFNIGLSQGSMIDGVGDGIPLAIKSDLDYKLFKVDGTDIDIGDIILKLYQLSGTIMDSDGMPIEGGEININQQIVGTDDTKITVSSIGEIVSDEDGHYLVWLWKGDSYDVIVKKSSISQTFNNISINEHINWDFNFDCQDVIDDYRVTARFVTPGGAVVNRAIVDIFRRGDNGQRLLVKQSIIPEELMDVRLPNGEYSLGFSIIPELRSMISGSNNGLPEAIIGQYGYSPFTVKSADISLGDIIFKLHRLTGVITDSNDLPVPDALVLINQKVKDLDGFEVNVIMLDEVKSDENGQYFVWLWESDDYYLTIKKGSNSQDFSNVSIREDKEWNISLDERRQVKSRFITPSGALVEGCRWSIFRKDSDGQFIGIVGADSTDGLMDTSLTDGEYFFNFALGASINSKIAGSTNGIPHYMFGNPGYKKFIVDGVDIDLGDIILNLHQLSGVLTDLNGVPLQGVQLKIEQTVSEYRSGVILVYQSWVSLVDEVETDEAGEYSVWLWQGDDYNIKFDLDGGIAQVSNYVLRRSQDLNVIIALDNVLPPAIQAGPFTRDITDTTATVEYFTNEPSYSVVNANGTEIRGEKLRTHHQVIINNLTKSTSYEASVYAEDAAGNQSLTDQITFTTLAETDQQLPSFTNTPTITQVAHNSASLAFNTDEATSAKAIVYKGDAIIASVTSANYAIQHQLEIPDLSAITNYTAVVEITDVAGNGPVKSVPLAFTTTVSNDVTPPQIISGPVIKNIKNGQATVIWTTDEPTLTALSYNDGVAYGVHRSEDYRRFHTVTIDHLTANTLYQLTVSATDAYNNGPTLTEVTDFYTLDTADSDPPTIIGELGIGQLGDSEALIQWRTDEPSSVMVRYGETAEALTLQTSAAVPQTFHRVALTNLKPDQVYFYQVVSTDTTGNSTTSATQSFTTKSAGENAPLTYFEIPQVLQVTDTSLTFGVRTNRAATSQIACKSDTGDVYQVATTTSAKQQQVILAGLTAGHNYACTIQSFDNVGYKIGVNIQGDTFGDTVIRTKTERDVLPPVITQLPQAVYLSDQLAVVNWQTDERADTVIKYRRQGSGQFQYLGELVYSDTHELVITGLSPLTTYEVIAQSRDMTGNIVVADKFTFSTASVSDNANPSFVAQPTIQFISHGVVHVSFTTNEPTWGRADYTDTNLNVLNNQVDERVGLHHTMVLNLNETKNYTLSFVIGDLVGNQNQSNVIELAFAGDDDGDGLSNAFELVFGGDPLSMVAAADSDNDGLDNLAEQAAGSNPNNPDSDGDGVNDGNDDFPTDPAETKDSDGDGIGDNADDINNLIETERYVFDRLWPQIPAPWYFQNIVAMDVDEWGNTYLVEYQDERHVWLKQLGSSGRIISNINLAILTDDKWAEVGGLVLSDEVLNILVYHKGSAAADQWRWHQLSDVGNYLGAVPLRGLSEQNIGQQDVKEVVVNDGDMTLLVNAGNSLTLLDFDADGQQTRLQRLLSVNVSHNLQLAYDSLTAQTLVAGDDGDCGQLWLFDYQYQQQKQLAIGTFKQNSCGVLQDIQFMADGNMVIDGQKELYIVAPSGGLVASQVTGLTGNKARFVDSSNDTVHLATQGRVRRYDKALTLQEDFSAFGSQSGYFVSPQFTVYTGENDAIYTLEQSTGRVQQFDGQGVFAQSFVLKTAQQRLLNATDLVIDQSGKIYVLENADSTVLIHQLDPQGNWLQQQAVSGGGYAVALHMQGDKLMALVRNEAVAAANTVNRIVALTPGDNSAQSTYPLNGFHYKALDLAGDGEHLFVLHVAADDSEHFSILTLDNTANVLKSNTLATRLNPQSPVAAESSLVYGRDQWFVTFGNEVHLYRAADGAFIQAFDQTGHLPGFSAAASLIDVAITNDDKMVWADPNHGRVQIFRLALIDLNTKAVIVAGGGPYRGNNLWSATLLSANEAYRTLITQGIAKDRIRFLANTTQDLDGNGLMDDVHDIASNATIADALTWANDASELILYMVDHGGIKKFRMQGNEILSAEQLNNQLAALPGKLTMIYDACKSGSFIDVLAAPGRTILTSSQPEQDAYFLSQGAISFSGVFWQQVLMGNDLQTAFAATEQVLSQMILAQTPMLSVDGSTTHSAALANRYIGVGRQYQHRAAVIQSGAATIENNAIVINANVVAGQTDIARVWAFILSENTTDSSAVEPRISLPTVELSLGEDGKYHGQFDDVVAAGGHQLVIYASDRLGLSSMPAFVEIEAVGIGKKAIVVAAYGSNSSKVDRVERQVELIYQSLRQQGYGDQEIYVLGQHPLADDDNSVTALEYAVTEWGKAGSGDMAISVVGDVKLGRMKLLDGSVSAAQFNGWVKTMEADGKDSLILSIDGSQSSWFAQAQTGFASSAIVIGATRDHANWYEGNYFSFSEYFWRSVASGETVFNAYLFAKRALSSDVFAGFGQAPYLDDTGNGVGDEKYKRSSGKSSDGLFARQQRIGAGILTADDPPLIDTIMPDEVLSGPGSVLYVDNIINTSDIAKVEALILYPHPEGEVPQMSRIELTAEQNGRYSGQYDFKLYGDYQVAFVATDVDGGMSLPRYTRISQLIGADSYEVDNDRQSASPIEVEAIDPQFHTIHHDDDEDWLVFYVNPDLDKLIQHRIVIDPVGDDLDVQVELYKEGQEEFLIDADLKFAGDFETIDYTITEEGLYYIRVSAADILFGDDTAYEIRVNDGRAGSLGKVTGFITSSTTGEGLRLARVKTDTPGYGALSLPGGSYSLTHPSDNNVNVTYIAAGFAVNTITVDVLEDDTVRVDIPLFTTVDLPPVVTAPAGLVRIVNVNAGLAASDPAIAAFLLSATVTDDNDSGLTASHNAPGMFGVGVTQVVFSATDSAGNTGTASATVTIKFEDITAPVITAPVAINLVSNDAGGLIASDQRIVDFLSGATATDNHDTGLTITHDAPETFLVGTTTVVFSATDNAGNIGTKSSTVFIRFEDIAAPVITAPAAISLVSNDDSGLPLSDQRIAAFLGGATVIDNHDTGLTITHNVPGTLPVGTTTVTFSAIDSAGNTGTQSSTVFIRFEDIAAPVMTAPAAINLVSNDDNGLPLSDQRIAAFLGGATVIDNHDTGLTITHNAPEAFPVGTTTVIFSATDNAGNTGTESSTITVSFEDIDAPVVTAPAAITLVANDTNGLSVDDPAIVAFLGGATVTDNHDSALTISHNAPNVFLIGITTVIFSSTDSTGNTGTASAIVNVTFADIDPPVVIAPAAITLVTNDINGLSADNSTIVTFLGGATATDNDNAVLTITHNAPNTFPIGMTVVVFSASDDTGNTGIASATVTVNFVDIDAPVVTAPAAIILLTTDASGLAANTPAIVVFLNGATVTDNQGSTPTITHDAPETFPIGTTTVIFSAADNAGNVSTSSTTVTVNFDDSVAPVVTAPAPITVVTNDTNGLPASEQAIVAFLSRATVTDNSDSFVAITHNAPETFPVGVTTIVFSASDSAGNTGIASTTVTVNFVDIEAPVIIAPATITLETSDANGLATSNLAVVTFLSGITVTDNIDSVLTINTDVPDVFLVGDTNVIFTATDSAGNTGTASTMVTVNFVEEPQVDPLYTQNLLVDNADITVAINTLFTVTLSYNTSDNNANTSELGIRVHYDSAQLAWGGFDGVLATSIIAQSQNAQFDDNDWDDNPLTDRYVEIAWADSNSQVTWPGVLPVDLFNIQFTLIASIVDGNTTSIGFTPISTGITQNESNNDVLYALKAPAINVSEETVFTLDIDGNGQAKALTDGILVIRYLFGFTGDALTDGVFGPETIIARDVETRLQLGINDLFLDIDGDGAVRALTDGLLVLRYLFGFRGDTLIDQVVSAEATRTSAAEIEAYLAQLIL